MTTKKSVKKSSDIESLVSEFSSKCDYVDVRLTNIKRETVMLENGETSNAFSDNESYGVRVIINGGSGLCSSNDLGSARSVFEKALSIAKLSSGKKLNFVPPKSVNFSKEYPSKVDPFDVDPKDKIQFLRGFESSFKKDSRVKNTLLIYQCEREERKVLSPCVNVSQVFINNIFRSRVTASESGIIQSAMKNYHHMGSYDDILALDINSISDEILGRADRLLHAKAPKAERAPVVCDPLMTGLFFHEAVGHACEADSILNNASVFNEMTGKLVASDEVNLFDDPTIEERGFYWFDDEGIKSRPTPLITNGVLTGFLHSLMTANELGSDVTGNGRCMDAEHAPIPRMSNTVLKKGKHSFDDLIKAARNGYLLKGFQGGVVDPITGQFSFGASECNRIVNGEIGEPLRDVTLGGSIIESLKGILVGNDPISTKITSTCGKQGQSVRVGDNCPSILVREAVIGGSA